MNRGAEGETRVSYSIGMYRRLHLIAHRGQFRGPSKQEARNLEALDVGLHPTRFQQRDWVAGFMQAPASLTASPEALRRAIDRLREVCRDACAHAILGEGRTQNDKEHTVSLFPLNQWKRSGNA